MYGVGSGRTKTLIVFIWYIHSPWGTTSDIGGKCLIIHSAAATGMSPRREQCKTCIHSPKEVQFDDLCHHPKCSGHSLHILGLGSPRTRPDRGSQAGPSSVEHVPRLGSLGGNACGFRAGHLVGATGAGRGAAGAKNLVADAACGQVGRGGRW